MMNGSITNRLNRQRKKVTSNGCMRSAARRISTFIITAQKPPTSIHKAARVVGARLDQNRLNGRLIIIPMQQFPVPQAMPSPALREREGPALKAREGEGFSGG